MACTGNDNAIAATPRSPLEQVHHLLVSLLRWWPYAPHERVPSLLLCGPTANGKSYLVQRAAEAAAAGLGSHATAAGESTTAAASTAPQRTRVVTVTPALAHAVAVQSAEDGSTGLRRLLRCAVQDACQQHSGRGAADAAASTGVVVLLVLDHLECYLQHADEASVQVGPGASLPHGNEAGLGDSVHTLFPALLADLYTVLRSCPPLFSSTECAALQLTRLVAVALFTGELDAVTPLVRHRCADFALALPTPTEAERRAFFQPYTAAATPAAAAAAAAALSQLPPPLADALALRTGGISYGGLHEVLAHALDYCDASSVAVAAGWDGHVAATAAQAVLRAYLASASVTAVEYRRSAGFVDVQVTQWGDIAGMAEVKATLQRLVTDPIRHRDAYSRFHVRPSTGVLLHGPPGTGKTMLAKAMATELNASFVYIDLPELVQSEVGESERRLQEFFDVARERSPAVVFMDEVQAAFGVRYAATDTDAAAAAATSHDARLVSHLLRLLDAAQQDDDHFVLFVGATNVVHLLDPLLLRAGRLDTLLEVPLPDTAARESLVRRVVHGEWADWFCGQEKEEEEEDTGRLNRLRDALVEAFVRRSDGFSGAEVRSFTSVFGLQLARAVSHQLAEHDTVPSSVVAGHDDSHDPRAEQQSKQLRLRRAITAYLDAADDETAPGLSRGAVALLDTAQSRCRA
ncbi:Cell division control protein 48 [Novymonas esmeraldas]|uniref:Cell division control protein 48 n=1 Tax=Novymonas esmeraldas TaxID=1808958 RepID=A0AAW0ERM0_9TRYP